MKPLFKSLFFSLTLLFCFSATAQKFPALDPSPMDAASYPNSYKISDKLIKVIYSRPQLKGRDINKLIPSDEVWRTGANEASEITFYQSVMFGDTKIDAGTYSLFTIPSDKEWIIIISSDINIWGAYNYSQDNDVARMKVPVTNSNDVLEAFSIVFEESSVGVKMHMGWGTWRVAVPIGL